MWNTEFVFGILILSHGSLMAIRESYCDGETMEQARWVEPIVDNCWKEWHIPWTNQNVIPNRVIWKLEKHLICYNLLFSKNSYLYIGWEIWTANFKGPIAFLFSQPLHPSTMRHLNDRNSQYTMDFDNEFYFLTYNSLRVYLNSY